MGGFSQGGAATLLSSFTLPIKLGGFICLSGYLPLTSRITALKSNVNDATSYFQGHGTHDAVVQYSWGTKSMEALKSHGRNVMFKTYEGMGHSSCDDEMSDLVAFIKSLMI